jgi:hypothetical protein
MADSMRFAAVAHFEPPLNGVAVVSTSKRHRDGLFAETPLNAARKWYWRLSPVERTACSRVTVSAWTELGSASKFLAVYAGPELTFWPEHGLREVG